MKNYKNPILFINIFQSKNWIVVAML
jgi:hypothetical protein